MDGIDEEVNEPSFLQRFGDLICSFRIQIFYLFVIQLVLLLLTLFSFVYVDPGSSSHVILYVDLAILLTTSTVVLSILYACYRREQW